MRKEEIINVLRIAEKTISTAESCTGGLVSKLITDIPGASEIFQYGFVTYSDEAKINILGVDEETLKKHTAVSEQVAIQMAKGAMDKSGSYIGLSVTGYAGGCMKGTTQDGTVFIAVVNKNGYEKVTKYHWSDSSRSTIRDWASEAAFNLILEGALKNGRGIL